MEYDWLSPAADDWSFSEDDQSYQEDDQSSRVLGDQNYESDGTVLVLLMGDADQD